MKYAIQVMYYFGEDWNPLADEYGTVVKPMYMGVDEKRRFVFNEKVVDTTKLFDTAKEAGEYLDKHFGPDKQRASYKTVRIVEVKA